MKSLIYKIAKSIVEKHENTKKQKEEKDRAAFERLIEKRKAHSKFITNLSKRFVTESANEFKKNNNPKFAVGDIAVTNWYGRGDSWEGSASSLQSHTPFRGPIDVEILSVELDSSELSELIYSMNENYYFNDIEVENDYSRFTDLIVERASRANGKTFMSRISWAYTIKVPGNDHEYWRYSWREDKLLSPKSSEAKWSKKAFKNQLESEKLNEERKFLEEKIKIQIEKANHIKVITR